MGRKSKKRRHQQQTHSVLHSLKDLGGDARDTLSRLATTVRAETPTLSLGFDRSGKIKDSGKGGALSSLYKSPLGGSGDGPSHATRLSSFAAKLNPLAHARAAFGRASTNRKLAQLSREMTRGNYAMQPVRRSRLPYVMAFVLALVGFGGWYVYASIDLQTPMALVEKHLDYKKWLAAVGGYVQGDASTSEQTEQHSQPRVQSSPGAAGSTSMTLYSSPRSSGSSSRYTSISTRSSGKSSYRGKGATVTSRAGGKKTVASKGAASRKAKYSAAKSSRRGKAAVASSGAYKGGKAKATRSGSKISSRSGKASKAKLSASRSSRSAKQGRGRTVRTGYHRN